MLLADSAAAEDAVQQVFASVLRAAADARLDAGERCLRRAVRNECFSMLRRRGRRDPFQVAPGAFLDRYRLVAMDLRGHGLSEKPREAYGDSRLWAEDVDAVIQGLELDRPVLCGWSYGPLVILDYLRHHGEAAIGGRSFVDSITKLGTEEAMSTLTAEFLGLPGCSPWMGTRAPGACDRCCGCASPRTHRPKSCT